MSAFQATIGGRFAPLATLVDEDADLYSMVADFNKAVTDTAEKIIAKEQAGLRARRSTAEQIFNIHRFEESL